MRYGKAIPRPASAPPNCRRCPKRGPENDSRYRLTEKNRRAWEAYQKYEGNWPDGWAEDELWVRNCQLIREAHRFFEANQHADEEHRFTDALVQIKQALK